MPEPSAQDKKNLNKIAAKFGERLQQLPIEDIMWGADGYSFDEQGDVTGLNLDKCKIDNISFLTDFPRLTHLRLSGNQISDISPLQALTKLTELDLRSNQISDLAPLQALTKLTWLNLERNQVADLSPLTALSQLTALYIGGNQVADLSPLQALTKLKILWLENNQVVDLSPIRALIPKIGVYWNYSPGWGIILNRNPLEIPPVEIVKKGKEAVLAYFASLEKEERAPLNEVKVLLVGDGAAGKTSLVKRLMDKDFDIDEPQTQGIDIDDWSVIQGNKSIEVHLWDFGGQEIMHATHQFFLSRRSLYVLVLDGRRDEKTEYWLKHIESFGGDSPALVVLNKIDTQPGFEVNRKFLQEKYRNIKGFYRLSCNTREGIPAFKEALQMALFQIEMTNITWPASWFKVKTFLEEMDEPYISMQRCDEICAEFQINEQVSRDTLVDFLHDLGVILHFKDFELEGTHVLSPRWATEAVYKIINSKELAEQGGTLRLSLLSKILKQKEKDDYFYPPDKYRYIIELMMKFEICYRLDSDRVLIPDLLAVEESEFTFAYDNALRFIFDYDFLPRSILPRFMVRRHKDIKEGIQWRTGVVLQDEAYHAEAVVKADEEKRCVYIYVSGEKKRDYFSIIRKTIRDINASFEKLKTTELVPLPDHPDITVEYEELTGLERMGIYDIPIGKLEKKYPVAQLLNGIEKSEFRIGEYTRIAREGGNIYLNVGQNVSQQSMQQQSVAQVTAVKQETNIAIDIKIDLPALKSDFFKLKDELAELAKQNPELAKELDSIADQLDELTPKSKEKELAKPLNKMSRFFEKLGDKDSRLSKILAGTKKGVELAQKLGRTYNKFAQWLALPQVPDVLVRKK